MHNGAELTSTKLMNAYPTLMRCQRRLFVDAQSLTYLQSLAKSILKYMKSYFPQLDSSMIRLSMAWSTLFGMFRSIIWIRT